MARHYVLFNPLSDNGRGEDNARKIPVDGDPVYTDIRGVERFGDFFGKAGDGARFCVCGGDGTLNRFVNSLKKEGTPVPEGIEYCATGSGNDFIKDIGGRKGEPPADISKYLVGLPEAQINGNSYNFVNGVGFGIDGYCCEVGDAGRARGAKKTDYTAIALRGLFGGYSPRSAEITIDGVRYTFDNVWLAPMMNGRYFGGGMMPTPEQDRLDPEGRISIMIFSYKNRVRTLMNFPKLFDGSHVKIPGCFIAKGHDITVTYDRPTPLQIDGETISDVVTCRCLSQKSRTTIL